MSILTKRSLRHIRNSFVLQQDAKDCGPACLLSLVRYYSGTGTMDQLRKLGGTTISGTTLLGLYEAAGRVGFDAEGCQADMAAVMEHPAPLVLHVLTEGNVQHYVVMYGYLSSQDGMKWVIGDPAKGIIFLTPDQLDEIWKTKVCLTLSPGKNFVRQKEFNSRKRSWVLGLIKDDMSILLVAAAIGLGIAALNMAMVIFSQRLVDDIIPTRNYTKFKTGLSLVLLLLLIKEGFNALRQYFLLRQSKDFNNRIITDFFKNLLQLPKAFFDSRKIGELTARLNDTSRIQKLIGQLAGNVIVDVFLLLVSIVFLMVYSWQTGVIVICSLPFYFVLVYLHHRPIIRAQQEVMMGYAMSEGNYIDTLRGIDIIKNHSKESLYAGQNQRIYNHYQEKVFYLGRIQVKLGLLANLFGICFLGGIIWYTTYSVFGGHLKTGELIAILGICSGLLPAVTNLALISIPANEARVAFDRMFEFLTIDPENTGVNEAADEAQHLSRRDLDFRKLEIAGLSFHFPGSKPILQHLSLHLRKGEIVAIIGENGCGKSTLLQIIQRLYHAPNGNIVINDNLPLYTIPLMQWRNVIGVVPQNVHIFNGTVLENIAFNDAHVRTQEVMHFLEQEGFAPFLDTLPQGVFTLAGEEGINLSGGQKQIIAIARALYHKPQLLILDEGTAAMDRNAEKFIVQLLERWRKKAGILFITHRLHVVKFFCDRIYIIDKGAIESSGTPDALFQSKNLYSEYWDDLNRN